MVRGPIELNGWPQGINNVAAPTAVPVEALRDAVNVDLSAEGKPRLRYGRVQRYTGTGVHSFFSTPRMALFAESGTLKRFWPNHEVTDLVTGLHETARISYAEINGDIYYTNGYDSGIIRASGVADTDGPGHPMGQPLLAVATGTLDAGTYQVAVTFISEAGEESGASLASVVTVPAGGGITLTQIPQPAAGDVRVYVSEPNGDVLRFVVDLPVGATSYTVTDVNYANEPLATQFCYSMPPGQITRYHDGRRWVATGSMVVCSEAFRYSLYKPTENYFMFPERVTNMIAVQDGLYVVADKTYFLSGSGPGDMRQIVASPYRGVEGTDLEVGVNVFGLEDQARGTVAYWFGEAGATIGLPSGLVKLDMDGRVAVPGYDSGASLLVEREGIRQMVTALHGYGDRSGYSVSDEVAVEVIRNGITL